MTPRQADADLRMYLRFAAGLPGFLSTRITSEQAEEIIRTRLVQREASLARLFERGIYGNPRSPYIPSCDLPGASWAIC